MKMKQAEFIALSACSMTLTALGIDIMLPAFAAVRESFGLSPDSTTPAQIISFFFMGQVAQIVFGIFSDRYGRLAILHIGFPLYIIGGFAAALAPDIPLMLAARFVAGVGASAVFMTTIAGVRDRFVGDRMAHIMSLVLTIFLFTPVLAPFLGIAVLSIASWKMVFLTPPLFAIGVFLWSLRLEESLPKEKRIKISWPSIKEAVLNVVTNRVFLRYTFITTCLFTALSSYVASSEHIVGEIYGRPELFAWIFGGMGLLMSLTTLLNSRLSSKFGARKTIRGLLIGYTLAGTFMLALILVLGDPPSMTLFFAAVVVMMSINLAIEPNSSALALEPMGNMAGIAASVYGTMFFSIGSTLGSIISHFMVDGVFPLVIGFFAAGVIALLLVLGDKRVILSLAIVVCCIGCSEEKKDYRTLTSDQLKEIADKDLAFAVFDEILNALNEDGQKNLALPSLTPGQRALCVTMALDGEVQNGGFNQYYYNTEPEEAALAEGSFREIGADKYADIVKKANTIYSEIKGDLEEKNDGTVPGFAESYENNPLNALDDEWYKLLESDPLDFILLKYIRRNVKDFALGPSGTEIVAAVFNKRSGYESQHHKYRDHL